MKEISWWRTNFGEEEIGRISDSITKEHVSQGPVTEEFERKIAELLQMPYVVVTTSGSMAILMALMVAGVSHDDEVIIPNRTWIAAAHATLLLGARAVLVDVQADLPLMDVSQIERKITPKTKVIMPVHLNGRSVDMDSVNRIAADFGLIVIEDAAQAFCSRNAGGILGGQSFAGCFSMSVAKLISTGQGGFVIVNDEETYQRLRMIRTHGVSDFINVSYNHLGFNFRFTDIQASIGIAQINRVQERIAKLKAIYERYAEVMQELPFLKLIPVDLAAGEIPLYIEVLCPERDKLVHFLDGLDIQTRPFYPDLNLASYLQVEGEFPNSRVFGQQGLFLPCGPGQMPENLDRVVEALYLYRESQNGIRSHYRMSF